MPRKSYTHKHQLRLRLCCDPCWRAPLVSDSRYRGRMGRSFNESALCHLRIYPLHDCTESTSGYRDNDSRSTNCNSPCSCKSLYPIWNGALSSHLPGSVHCGMGIFTTGLDLLSHLEWLPSASVKQLFFVGALLSPPGMTHCSFSWISFLGIFFPACPSPLH